MLLLTNLIFLSIRLCISSTNYIHLLGSNMNYDHIIDSRNNSKIYATFGKQILMEIKNTNHVPNFEYLCNVDQLTDNFPLIAALFCFKRHMKSKEICFDVMKNIEVLIINKSFIITFNKLTGFKVTASNQDIQFSSGYYYCKLQTNLEDLQSDYMEIKHFDAEFQGEIQANKDLTIYSKGLPDHFDCGHSRMDESNYDNFQQLYPDMMWHACLVQGDYKMFHASCLSNPQSQITFEMNKDYFQYRNGSIVLSSQFIGSNSKFGLLCTFSYATNHLLSQFVIDTSSIVRSNTKEVFDIFTPSYSKVYINEGSAPSNQYKLLAGYRIRENLEFEYNWRKDKFDVPSTFHTNSNELFFPDTIEVYHQGIYELVVTETHSGKSIYFTFKVVVIGVPKLKNKNESLLKIFRFPGQSVNFSGEFEGYEINVVFFINGMEMNLHSKRFTRQSVDNLKRKYYYFSNISLKISKSVGTNNAVVHYDAKNLQPLDLGKKEIHLINIIARNPAGKVQLRRIIEVLDKPKWRISSVKFVGNEEIHCECEIFEDQFSSRDIRFEYKWIVNESLIEKINILNNSYKINKTKLIFNTKSNQKIHDFLKKSNFSCEVLFLDHSTSDVLYTMHKILTKDNEPSPASSNVIRYVVCCILAAFFLLAIIVGIYRAGQPRLNMTSRSKIYFQKVSQNLRFPGKYSDINNLEANKFQQDPDVL